MRDETRLDLVREAQTVGEGYRLAHGQGDSAMNRADLSWGLSATLPHAGKLPETAVVGFDYIDGSSFAYATDRYTTGIARIPGADIRLTLPAREATDLLRFIRPNRVGEQAETVDWAVRPGELHVGTADDSAVFETVDSPLSLDHLMNALEYLYTGLPEWEELIFQPDLLSKFSKAKRTEADRLRIYPRHCTGRNGAAVVTVGTVFIGAVAGMTYDQQGPDTVSAFLNLTRKVEAA